MIASPFPDIHIPDDIPLSKFVLDEAEKYGNEVAMVDAHTGQQITFKEIITQSRAVGSALWRRGLRQGDVMVMYSPNCIEYVVMFHAVVGQGGIISTCNHLFIADELLSQMKDSQAKYVFTHRDHLPNVIEAQRNYHNLKAVIAVDNAPGAWDFRELLRDDGSAFPDVNIDVRNDVAVLPYSSGTTGKPKGVMLTHYNLIANMMQLSHSGSGVVVHGRRFVFTMPFFHIYGIVIVMLGGIRARSHMVIMRQYTLNSFLTAMVKYKADFLYAVPPILVQMSKDPDVSRFNLSRVTMAFCGGAPLSKEVISAVRKRFPHIHTLCHGYGMTELSPIVLATEHRKWDGDAVGIPVPNTVIKIVDPDTQKVLGPNEDGEIVAKGPQVMKGYLGNRAATLAMINDDGWLHTGDVGHYDEKGVFYVVDRIKELIKYKGYQVAPAQLEGLLLKMPGVADAAVIGIPDDMAGELPRAFIVKKPGATITEADVVTHIHDHVAPQKRLHGGAEFVEEIVKSASGKILRRLIRDQVKQRNQTKSKL